MTGYFVAKKQQSKLVLTNCVDFISTLNNFMLTEKQSKRPRKKAPTRGGAREGAGRPKGSTDKVTAKQLLETAQAVIGKPFVESLMEGYRDSITDNDRKHRVIYEKIIIDKVATTLFDVEVTEGEDAIESKRKAFAEALAAIATEVKNTQDNK